MIYNGTVDPQKTPEMTSGLVRDWNLCMRDKTIYPLIALAFFNLDFLCIHPFRDGNGRDSRLLLLLQTYLSGYEVDRYITQAGVALRGEKTLAVLEAIKRLPMEFTLAELENESPGVSHDMVRKILKANSGTLVECLGKDPGAKWRKKGITFK